MKTFFIPAKLKSEANKSKILEISKELPKEIAITYSIQYEPQAKEIQDILAKTHNITKFIQVLGCSKPKLPKGTQAILLMGDGKFHAVSLAYETKLPVYILNRSKLEKISKKDTESLEKKQKAAYVKFLNANNIGILVSTKPGQQKLKKAFEFRKRSKKNSYVFLSNEINTLEFENFPQIQSWINTACPRIDMNSNIVINIDKIKQ